MYKLVSMTIARIISTMIYIRLMWFIAITVTVVS